MAIKRARHMLFKNLLSLFIYIIGPTYGLHKQHISSFYSNRVLIITIEIEIKIKKYVIIMEDEN